jgi:hypothetical protein
LDKRRLHQQNQEREQEHIDTIARDFARCFGSASLDLLSWPNAILRFPVNWLTGRCE